MSPGVGEARGPTPPADAGLPIRRRRQVLQHRGRCRAAAGAAEESLPPQGAVVGGSLLGGWSQKNGGS